MNKILAFLIGLLLPINIIAMDNWITVEVTGFAEIQFPGNPETMEKMDGLTYLFQDSTSFYMVDIKVMQELPVEPLTNETLKYFYENYINGAIDAANAELVRKNEITIDDYQAMSAHYVTSENPQLPDNRFKSIVLVENILLSIDFWTSSNKLAETESVREYFVNSFKIIANSHQSQELESKDRKVYNIGYQLGKISAFVVFIGVLLGVFFLVRFIIRKIKGSK